MKVNDIFCELIKDYKEQNKKYENNKLKHQNNLNSLKKDFESQEKCIKDKMSIYSK